MSSFCFLFFIILIPNFLCFFIMVTKMQKSTNIFFHNGGMRHDIFITWDDIIILRALNIWLAKKRWNRVIYTCFGSTINYKTLLWFSMDYNYSFWWFAVHYNYRICIQFYQQKFRKNQVWYECALDDIRTIAITFLYSRWISRHIRYHRIFRKAHLLF